MSVLCDQVATRASFTPRLSHVCFALNFILILVLVLGARPHKARPPGWDFILILGPLFHPRPLFADIFVSSCSSIFTEFSLIGRRCSLGTRTDWSYRYGLAASCPAVGIRHSFSRLLLSRSPSTVRLLLCLTRQLKRSHKTNVSVS